MADIGTAIRLALVADATVAASVGARIQPDVLPQGETWPAVTYTIITGASHGHTGGRSEFADCVMQVNCWATTQEAATAASEVIRKFLDTYRDTSDGVFIHAAFPGEFSTDYVPPQDASDLPLYVHRRDYRIFYAEDV